MREKILSLIMVAFICSGIVFGQSDNQTGQVIVSGKYIETVTLMNSDYQHNDINEVNTPVSLPAGNYEVQSIKLTGGFESLYPGINVDVDPNETSRITAGAPLKQHIETSRIGRLLKLKHKITGVNGEEYTPVDNNQKPVFTISQNGEEIFSDSFEYG